MMQMAKERLLLKVLDREKYDGVGIQLFTQIS
jgi:hypothetical protein